MKFHLNEIKQIFFVVVLLAFSLYSGKDMFLCPPSSSSSGPAERAGASSAAGAPWLGRAVCEAGVGRELCGHGRGPRAASRTCKLASKFLGHMKEKDHVYGLGLL